MFATLKQNALCSLRSFTKNLGFTATSAIGVAGAYVVGRLMQSTLYDVPAFDTFAFMAMFGVLLVAALFASFLPAWRASRVEPITPLRDE